MKAKPNQLKAQWSKSQKDIVFAWGEGIHKSDAHLLYAALNLKMKDGGTSLEEELLARGYDLTTLRFSVQKTRLTMRAADGVVCPACKSTNAFEAVICVDCGAHTAPHR